MLHPIAADLQHAGVETLLYAADGQLRYIPLATLHDGKQWLVEQFTINQIIAVSLTNFEASREQNLLAIDSGKLQTTTFFDHNFSRSAVEPQLENYAVVHLVTHAEFVSRVLEESFILFGNGL